MLIVPRRELIVSPDQMYRVRRGLYSHTGPTSARHGHFLRTAAALHSRHRLHIASHISAAVLHDLPLFDADLGTVHLTTAEPQRRGTRAGVHIHEGPTDSVVEIHGLLVTDLAQTLVDCARTLPRDQAVAMVDFALHEGLTTKPRLQELLQPRSQWRSQQARRVIALADGRAESVGETRSRLILLDNHIAVTPQVWVRDDDGHRFARMDLVLDGWRMGVEFDGQEKTDLIPGQQRAEKERNDLVADHGWILVPVYWRHCCQPQVFMSRIHRGLARAERIKP